MKKLFTILSTVEKGASEDGRFITVRGMASTSDVDRGGDIISAEAWTKGGLENFMKNPVILFQHDSDRPIGKCSDIKVVEKGLEITAKISKSDPIASLIEDGVVTAFSVGARIRDADYIKETGGLLIKDAELYEVSVVSIPANQNALFSVVKSFSQAEFELYKKQLPKGETEATKPAEGTKKTMDREEILKMIADAIGSVEKAKETANAEAARIAAEKKAAEELEAAKKAAADAVAAVESIKSGTEALIEKAVEAATNAGKEQFEAVRAELAEKSAEIAAFTKSKRSFEMNSQKDWEKAAEPMLRDAYVLGAILNKGWNTKHGQEVIEKVNDMSGVAVPATSPAIDVYENIVSTAIEREIQHKLILAPLFREIQMNAASMVLPIMPDAGYAEFIATKKLTNTGDDAPHGNLTQRGDSEGSPYGGIDMTSKLLTTKKLMSVSFVANETEEDTILAVMPLIQESMVRAHARAVERAMLRGGSGIAGSFNGLTTFAATNSMQQTSTTAFASEALTAQDLLNMRKTMGVYGIDPSEVVYIVNEREYYNLLDDPEFKDANLVGPGAATKLTGQVGNLYGSRVMLCDEFSAPATSAVHAVAVNVRNFLVPRIRGVTIESQYIPRAQHLELVATQRLGFDELITGAKAVVSRRYAAA